MTRFARARGSKASNERAPADSTPWEVMKEQLLQSKKDNDDSKNRKEAEQKRIENYENFLKEQKVQKRKSTWCDFPESEHIKSVNNEQAPKTKIKNKKSKTKNETDHSDHSKPEPENHNKDEINSNNEIKKSKKKKKKLQNDTQSPPKTETLDKMEPVQTIKKGKKGKQKSKTVPDPALPNSKSDNTTPTESNQKVSTDMLNNKQPKNKKNKKLVNGKPVRRKAINDHSFQLIINGKEIELERFDGFPVMKKDAERLKELMASMLKKGIPKSEVQRTIKLERRRAEKALARAKKDVCYNCRKGGHVLSDCPELKEKIPGGNVADGVCFKCGSTEHRQFECKVQREKEFRFATCFICKEPGHIARQCPDNPKGLYPNGGNCKLCGDVTHLRKDCPTAMDKKEDSSIKLHTIDSGENIEDVGMKSNNFTFAETTKKPKKIKF